MYMTRQMRITLLIYLYHDIEKFLYTLSCAADGRHDRHSKKVSQLLDVQLITLCLELIVHVHSHDHAKVHIDELGSQV